MAAIGVQRRMLTESGMEKFSLASEPRERMAHGGEWLMKATTQKLVLCSLVATAIGLTGCGGPSVSSTHIDRVIARADREYRACGTDARAADMKERCFETEEMQECERTHGRSSDQCWTLAHVCVVKGCGGVNQGGDMSAPEFMQWLDKTLKEAVQQ